MIIKFSCKFETWFKALENIETKGALHIRFSRILNGNHEDCESIGDEIFKLSFDVGPGYRIYFCYHIKNIIILFGGIRKNQTTAIKHAINIRKEMIQGKT